MLVMETFAERLRVARALKQLSRAALAQAVGTNEKRIQRLENGLGVERLPHVMGQRLGNVLGVSLEWLLTGQEPPL